METRQKHRAAMVSVFDLFSIGIGPSSSHTVGPMRAARTFLRRLQADGLLAQVARLRADLFGSLGATGRGHGSDYAVILGLLGCAPETIDPAAAPRLVADVHRSGLLRLPAGPTIPFDESTDLVLDGRRSLPGHSNGMTFRAFATDGAVLVSHDYYSIGGGFLLDPNEDPAVMGGWSHPAPPYPFITARPVVAS